MKKTGKDNYSFLAIFSKWARFFYLLFLKPKSENDDLSRREFIFNILFSSSIFALVILFIISLFRLFFTNESTRSRGFTPDMIFIVLLFFLVLFWFSRKGYFQAAAYIFLALYFVPVTYMLLKWGANIPQGLLMYVLLIVMSGILINARFAFFTTIFLCSVLGALSFLQINEIIKPNLYWKSESFKYVDFIAYATTFAVIAVVSWLSNREIEKSLERARHSEAELRQERDLLEVRVEERTRELKQAQMEKWPSFSNLPKSVGWLREFFTI